MFPAKQILEKTFLEVLNSRYSIPGLLVKDILLEQFKLMRYFHLMKHLYMFDEDIIFPFYKNMFQQVGGILCFSCLLTCLEFTVKVRVNSHENYQSYANSKIRGVFFFGVMYLVWKSTTLGEFLLVDVAVARFIDGFVPGSLWKLSSGCWSNMAAVHQSDCCMWFGDASRATWLAD